MKLLLFLLFSKNFLKVLDVEEKKKFNLMGGFSVFFNDIFDFNLFSENNDLLLSLFISLLFNEVFQGPIDE